MHIGIDVSRTAETKTGLASYAESLVAALARVDPANRYSLYSYTWHCFPHDPRAAFRPRAPNFRRSRRWLPRVLVRGLWQRDWVSKDWLVGDPPDVYFSPFHSVPPRRMGKLVCVFHDVAFRTHPEFSTDWNREFCEQQIDEARRRADRIVTVSHFSKAEIVRHFRIPAERIDVVLEAADRRFRRIPGIELTPRLQRLTGGGEYLLYVGSVEPRKNLITLVRAYARLRASRSAVPMLIVAGGSGWKNSDVHAAVEQSGLQDAVRFAGFVSDDELVALYNRAMLFVYPTLYEGFGLPVIEAMSCGCPVVTTHVASIPEVGGDAVAYYRQPANADALAQVLAALVDAPQDRLRLAEAGMARSRLFSWEKAARETLDILLRTAGTTDAIADLHMGVDERALDRGWHGLERDAEGCFRWTGPAASIVFRAAAPRSVILECASPVPQQRLTVTVQGQRAGSVVLEGAWTRHELPCRAAGGEVVVRLDVAPEVPRTIKAGDARRLGARVRRVTLLPTGG